METVLQLLKLDLGISHSARDTLLNAEIQRAKAEIERKGIELNLEEIEDVMLLTDYTAWVYKKRNEDVPLAKNIAQRIRDRIVQKRAGD